MDGQQAMVGTWPAREALWLSLDAVAAAALCALSVSGAAARTANFGVPAWFAVTAAAATAVPLAVRRRRPTAVLAVVLTANAAVTVAGVSGNAAVMVALAMYTVAVTQAPRRSVAMMAVAAAVSTGAAAAGVLAAPLAPGWQVRFDIVAATLAVVPAAWALGAARRSQLLQAASAARQAARRAVAEERLRIARELHDVITHSMSLITVKASVAAYLMDSQPEGVREALTVIEATGRQALAETRQMLGVLRSDGETSGYDERAPVPGLGGLGDLAALAAHAEQAGVRVDLSVLDASELPGWATLTVYRIVREALTNVVKHAAPTSCQVRVARSQHDLRIAVTNAAGRPGSQPSAGGHGLIGMRERVALFGGTFEAGPVPGGGFRVSARLPLESTGPAAVSLEPAAGGPRSR